MKEIKKLNWNVVVGDDQTKDELFTDPILIHCPIQHKSMLILEHYEIISDDSDPSDIEYYIYAIFTNGESELLYGDLTIDTDTHAKELCQMHFESILKRFYETWTI